MKKDLQTEMAKPEFQHVNTRAKLAEKLGEMTGNKPSEVTIWHWTTKQHKPSNKQWLDALAKIFNIQFGEQFFL